MKKPAWATVVGILGIIFGCLGILSASQEILMPKMIKFQEKIFSEIEKSAKQKRPGSSSDQDAQGEKNANKNTDIPLDMLKSLQKMMEFPEWFQTWSVYSGTAKAIVSLLYLFSSILILLMKPAGIRFFYWAAGSSILLNILKSIAAAMVSALIGMAVILGAVISSVIDIVLIVVVATGEKEAFYQVPPPLNV